ncbi:MAG TPA: cysteine synthase A [Deinococcales bacterium]|nr:cysteine synthase A [Deinococcales bacterium]
MNAFSVKPGSIEGAIGRTPTVRLERVVARESAELWVKLEGMNPGGSIKDRAALGMILDAEERGLLRPGGLIVEPTSGNTGIGLAQVAAARGYRLVLTMPSSMTEERRHTLRAYGAELVLTEAAERMTGAIEAAERIREERGAFMPDQFGNPANPLMHYRTTGPEIWEALEGRVDYLVYGSGTGGTITGAGRFLKERNPKLEIVAVEAAKSNVLGGGEKGAHGFQGMSPGFIPKNLDVSLIDRIVTVLEDDAYPFGRRLAAEEGVFVGMSASGILLAAARVAEEVGPGKRVVTLAPDSGAKYLSTVLFNPPQA